jgi:hypothetical protein
MRFREMYLGLRRDTRLRNGKGNLYVSSCYTFRERKGRCIPIYLCFISNQSKIRRRAQRCSLSADERNYKCNTIVDQKYRRIRMYTYMSITRMAKRSRNKSVKSKLKRITSSAEYRMPSSQYPISYRASTLYVLVCFLRQLRILLYCHRPAQYP